MTDTETPHSQASKKVRENMAMVWLVSLFLIGHYTTMSNGGGDTLESEGRSFPPQP